MKRVVLLFFWFIISTWGYAYDFMVDGIYYSIVSLENKTVSVVSGDYYYQGDIFIPSQVKYNGKTLSVIKIDIGAFDKSIITSIQLSEGLQEIGQNAFSECKCLKEIIVPNSVSTIANNAFSECENLSYVKLPNALKYLGNYSFFECYNLKLYSERLPSTLARIKKGTFNSCWALKRIVIPNTIETIDNAFDHSGLRYLKIEDGEKPISLGVGDMSGSSVYNRYYNGAFTNCKIDSLYLGRNMVYKTGKEEDGSYYNNYETPFYKNDGIKYLNIGQRVTNIPTFSYSSLKIIMCQSEKPFEIDAGTFSNSTYAGAILYVPTGSKSLYESAENWGKFFNIQEMNIEEMNNNNEYKKCDMPTIDYSNGKLTFNCTTEGAVCNSTINDSDIRSYSGNEIQLEVTYSISVYATKNGYADSDVANATLCWIDVEPKSEGISNNVAQVRAHAVLIQSDNGRVTISGLDKDTVVSVYSISGQLIGSAKTNGNQSSLVTNLKPGDIAIIKIGEKSVKVVMQ